MNKFKKVYRILYIAICIVSLYLCISPVKENKVQLFLYFTIESNIICLLYFIYLLFNEKENLLIKNMITMSIIVTMLIYNLMLTGEMNEQSFSLSNTLLHLVCPLMVVFDYLLFSKKGKIKLYYPLTNVIIPYVYYIFIIILAHNGMIYRGFGKESSYPYFFMDVNALGIKNVVMYIIILTLAFIFLGYIFVFIDRIIYKTKIKKSRQ